MKTLYFHPKKPLFAATVSSRLGESVYISEGIGTRTVKLPVKYAEPFKRFYELGRSVRISVFDRVLVGTERTV